MNASIQCNQETQLYIISNSSFYGFDYVLNTCLEIISQFKTKLAKSGKKPLDSELNDLMKQADILPALRGTEKLFSIYNVLLSAAKKVELDTFFHHQTPAKVRRILEKARKSGQKLRIFYGDTETGRDWLEENDVMGSIGRSSGVLKIPLLISDDEFGGPGLLDHCIVRIIDCSSRKELYRAPNYQEPDLVISELSDSDDLFQNGYTHSVINRSNESKAHANCCSYAEACNQVAFLKGVSMTPTF